MWCRIAELRYKEVINMPDAARLGFVDDIEVDSQTAVPISLVVFGKPKLFGLLGKRDDVIIPWNDIKVIGDEVILVDIDIKEKLRPTKTEKECFFRL